MQCTYYFRVVTFLNSESLNKIDPDLLDSIITNLHFPYTCIIFVTAKNINLIIHSRQFNMKIEHAVLHI